MKSVKKIDNGYGRKVRQVVAVGEIIGTDI